MYGIVPAGSVNNPVIGDHVAVGIPAENGHWPSHLHFQIIEDIGDWKGDYPGVCKESEQDKYLMNCPDPDIILDLMKYARREKVE